MCNSKLSCWDFKLSENLYYKTLTFSICLKQSNEGDSDSLNGEDVPDVSGPTNSVLPSIILPKDYDSVQPINDLESINNFAMKSNSATSLDSEDESNCDSAKVSTLIFLL